MAVPHVGDPGFWGQRVDANSVLSDWLMRGHFHFGLCVYSFGNMPCIAPDSYKSRMLPVM